MAAFFRGLLLFLSGAFVGAVGILLFAPSFNVVVSRGAIPSRPIEVAATPAPVPAPVAATVAPAAPKAAVPAATPPAAVAAAPTPDAPSAPEPAIDFKSISEHLILWPTSVTVKAATTVPVLVDGKKVQDLALEAGTVLQVSKVLADGSIEARAKGAKFEIRSTLTDFSVELGKRVAELVAKGTKFDSPFASAAPAPATVTPAPAVAPAPAASVPVVPPAVVTVPWVRLTLAQRVDVLFGNKPDAAVPAPTATPTATPAAAPTPSPAPAAAPAAPVVEAAPAADPKAVEKGKDLDRKINQLFK